MKMKFPLFRSNIRPHSTLNRLAGTRKAAVLLMLIVLQAGFSSFVTPHNRSTLLLSSPTSAVTSVAEWVLYGSVRNVDFYYQITGCNGDKVVLLKFNNRNSDKVTVSWKEVFTTQFENDKEGLKGKKSLLLGKGETFESDCSNVTIKECIIYASQVAPAYKADIKKFNFKDISVVNH